MRSLVRWLQYMYTRVWGLEIGNWVWGLEFGVWGLVFGLWVVWIGDWGLGIVDWRLGSGVWGLIFGFWAWRFGGIGVSYCGASRREAHRNHPGKSLSSGYEVDLPSQA